jgi:LysM repeat protein
MAAKRFLQLIMVIAILATCFAATGGAQARSGGCASYITVQWGDTLSELAANCGTTVEAIQAANPDLGWWLYAGEVIYIPTGYTPAPANPPQTGSTYTIQWGDTLGSIATKMGFSLSDVLAVNPQIWNINLIYPGQVINLPAAASVPPAPAYYPPAPVVPQYGTLKISYAHGLLVRTGPGKNYAQIQSPLVSAVVDTEWQYRKDSVTIDSVGYVWVEVTLNPLVNGYTTGWILVRDTFGRYYTQPLIDP